MPVEGQPRSFSSLGQRVWGGGRFEIRRVIGRGAMGVVYEALDRKLDLPVALKTLHAPDAHAIYRLKKEFRLVQDLQHENLVALGELVEDEGTWFFTMELLDGVDFRTYVRGIEAQPPGDSQPPPLSTFDETRLREALGQLLRGLDVLHVHDFVHRDVKPSNVLVTSEGRTVLLDFGLATAAGASMQSMADHVVGTAHYMAPEQAASRMVTAKADMYAVGVMLYEALTGRPPLDGNMLALLMRKQSEVETKPSELAPNVPADLEALCMDLLRIDPDARPDAASALLRLGLDPRHSRSFSTSHLLSEAGMLLGRDKEQQALRAALARTREHGTQAVLVRGGSGLGKTTLIQAFCSEVSHSDEPGLVVSGRCYEREITPYRGFDAVIDELARHLRMLDDARVAELVPADAFVLTRLFPVLGRVGAIARGKARAAPGGDQQHLRTRAFECLRAILAGLSKNEPIVIFIDDVQWADGDGLTLLSDLVRGNDAPRVLWLLASRMGEEYERDDGPVSVVRSALGPRLTELEIGLLDPDASHKLAYELLNRVDPQSIGAADDVAREAKGFPLHIVELVQHTALRGWSEGTPPRLDDVIWERIHQLPEEASQALRVVCTAPGPLSNDLIARASGFVARQTSRLVAMLRVAHLVRWTPQGMAEPYHERVRIAVLQRMTEAEQQAVHAQIAHALETELDRPELLVHHLRAMGDAVRTARLATQAGHRAVNALAFDRAATLYQIALDAGGHKEDEERSLRLCLARALVNMGRCAAAAAEFVRAASGADPETRLEAMRLAAEQLLVSGHIELGLEVAKDLLAELKLSLPRTPRAALFSLLWHRLRLWFRGLAWHERRAGQLTREQINLVEVLRAVGQGLAMVDNIRGADFNARFLLRALELGDRGRVAQALGSEATYRGSQGLKEVTQARNLARTVQDIAERQDDPYYQAWSNAISGTLDYFEGRFERAEQRLKRAIMLYRAETTASNWELSSTILFRIFSLRHMGAVGTLQAEFERELREAERRGDRNIETSLRRYCNFLWLARDDAKGAEENLSIAPWAPPDGRFHLQHWYELDARTELDLYRDSVRGGPQAALARFVPVERSMLMRVQTIRALATWLKGRLLLACGDEGDQRSRLRMVEKLAKKLKKEGQPYSLAWGGMLEAAVHASRGERERASQRLREVAQLADDYSMKLLAAAARLRLGELTTGEEGARLVRTAEEAMRAAPVKNPRAFANLLAPGFQAKTAVTLVPAAP
jgi:tRNA A-37 threonylcarbamoyl transferase component Bud32